MRAAVNGVDGVGEGENIFGVAIVILERDFHVHLAALAFHIDRRVVERLLAAIEVLDELGDAAGEAELGFLVVALIIEGDFQAFIEEGQLTEALRKRVEAVIDGGKDRRVGMERDFRSGFFRFAGGLELGGGDALLVELLPDLAVAPDF